MSLYSREQIIHDWNYLVFFPPKYSATARYPLVVQPLYIGADHPSYISKKVHKISVFMYFRPKKWILQVRFAP